MGICGVRGREAFLGSGRLFNCFGRNHRGRSLTLTGEDVEHHSSTFRGRRPWEEARREKHRILHELLGCSTFHTRSASWRRPRCRHHVQYAPGAWRLLPQRSPSTSSLPADSSTKYFRFYGFVWWLLHLIFLGKAVNSGCPQIP